MLYLHPMILGLTAIGLIAQLGVEPSEKAFSPPTQVSADPTGWQDFQWDMTKRQALGIGAEVFLDDQKEEHFGLADVDILPGKKHFRVYLQFFSHIGLSGILIKMKEHAICAEEEYRTLLHDLKGKYGEEKETKNLNYPNAFMQSHIWIVKTTKITLHHSCSKPRKSSSNKSFLTSIHYEKRLFIELRDR
jgi:hypothetical protein